MTKTERTSLMLTPAMRQELEARAAAEDCSLGHVIRRLLEAALALKRTVA